MKIIRTLIGFILPKRHILTTNDIYRGFGEGYFTRLYLLSMSSNNDGSPKIIYGLIDKYGRRYHILCDKTFTDEFFMRLAFELHEFNIGN